MADLYDLLDEQRRQLGTLDRVAAGQMGTAYARLLAQAHTDLDAFDRKLESWQAAHPSMDPRGSSPSRHWVFQQDRYQQLVEHLQVNGEFYAKVSSGAIASAQDGAMRLVQMDHEKLMRQALGGGEKAQHAISFATLPEEAIAAVVGFSSNGTPLDTLLRQRAFTAKTNAAATLVDGVAFGRSPKAVATTLDSQLNEMHWQNLRVARTEMMRAYREGQRVNMLQNASVLSGWRWSSAADRRTCPVCMSQHGKVFPIQQVKPSDVPPDTAQHQGLGDLLARPPVGGGATIEKNAVTT